MSNTGCEACGQSSAGFMAPVAGKDVVYWRSQGSRISVLRPFDGMILEQLWVDKTEQTTVQDRVVLFVVSS